MLKGILNRYTSGQDMVREGLPRNECETRSLSSTESSKQQTDIEEIPCAMTTRSSKRQGQIARETDNSQAGPSGSNDNRINKDEEIADDSESEEKKRLEVKRLRRNEYRRARYAKRKENVSATNTGATGETRTADVRGIEGTVVAPPNAMLAACARESGIALENILAVNTGQSNHLGEGHQIHGQSETHNGIDIRKMYRELSGILHHKEKQLKKELEEVQRGIRQLQNSWMTINGSASVPVPNQWQTCQSTAIPALGQLQNFSQLTPGQVSASVPQTIGAPTLAQLSVAIQNFCQALSQQQPQPAQPVAQPMQMRVPTSAPIAEPWQYLQGQLQALVAAPNWQSAAAVLTPVNSQQSAQMFASAQTSSSAQPQANLFLMDQNPLLSNFHLK
ncbi:uncharacterized protein LOC103315563 isoform X1 [Nasonia vitripennis]|uniref:Uncharacterized protein n=2 Tax=Nasonia vitripennis TaxID=7425 RepID=A0A7M7QVD2_NASVI|nr:uncharacterized protein LOC103315563 isoform X1 [Nasonia vitripennis]XP_031780294.1 uncharacterized protein LOC103315563 isoform X1 [Nasonia vitripennis]XP_032453364.1 uncharacterized protein LOC103315563 isoform X1 [Nasonia vitripennis]